MCEVCASELADPLKSDLKSPCPWQKKATTQTRSVFDGVRLFAKSKQSHSLVQQMWTASILVLFYMCKGAGRRGQVIPTFDSGFVANVINQKVFLSISQAPTRRWSFWQRRCLLLCHELLGRKRVSQPDANFRTELCSLLECSARSGSAPLQRQWYLQWQGALFLGRGTMIHATVSCAASPRKG